MTKAYYSLFNFIVLSLIIYAGVDMFYDISRSKLSQVTPGTAIVTPSRESSRYNKPPFRNFKVIHDRNLFNSLEKTSGISKEEDFKDLEPTSLKLTLLGTVAGPQENARAVILETSIRKQGLYKVGDTVQDASIKKILREKIVLRVGDKDEILVMEEPSSPKSPGPVPSRLSRHAARGNAGPARSITVNRSEIDSALKDINQLLSQARIQPHFSNGDANGVSISRIKRGSIFSKLGLRNGDIIKDINGNALDSPDDLFSMYENLKSGSSASIKIIRRGRPQDFNYRFK